MLSCFSCVQLCNLMDCSPPGSSVHEIIRARVLEWVAMPPSRDLYNPGIESLSLTSPALAGGFFTTCATWEAHNIYFTCKYTVLYQWGSWGCYYLPFFKRFFWIPDLQLLSLPDFSVNFLKFFQYYCFLASYFHYDGVSNFPQEGREGFYLEDRAFFLGQDPVTLLWSTTESGQTSMISTAFTYWGQGAWSSRQWNFKNDSLSSCDDAIHYPCADSPLFPDSWWQQASQPDLWSFRHGPH